MPDEKIPVDMTRHQRPYTRGPQTRKNLEDEFAREFPGERLSQTGEALYEEMERRIRQKQTASKLEKGQE
jgi:hypothetical protein